MSFQIGVVGGSGYTGAELLRQIKTQSPDTPVIMITANAHNVTRQQAEQSGAALFLTKPFSPSQLVQEIQKLVPAGAGA